MTYTISNLFDNVIDIIGDIDEIDEERIIFTLNNKSYFYIESDTVSIDITSANKEDIDSTFGIFLIDTIDRYKTMFTLAFSAKLYLDDSNNIVVDSIQLHDYLIINIYTI